jgi:hypothetical protein
LMACHLIIIMPSIHFTPNASPASQVLRGRQSKQK